MKIGIGYDIHRFKNGRKLIIGGIEIPYHLGLLGHSDADVLTHSIIDSLLGASNSGDIGWNFPDTSCEFKNISSMILLERTKEILDKKNYEICNIDSTLILENPKMNEFRQKIIINITKVLNIQTENFNVKFKTNEGCDSMGVGKAIAAHAVSLLKLIQKS